jgi:hypothetical protein
MSKACKADRTSGCRAVRAGTGTHDQTDDNGYRDRDLQIGSVPRVECGLPRPGLAGLVVAVSTIAWVPSVTVL